MPMQYFKNFGVLRKYNYYELRNEFKRVKTLKLEKQY